MNKLSKTIENIAEGILSLALGVIEGVISVLILIAVPCLVIYFIVSLLA